MVVLDEAATRELFEDGVALGVVVGHRGHSTAGGVEVSPGSVGGATKAGPTDRSTRVPVTSVLIRGHG